MKDNNLLLQQNIVLFIALAALFVPVIVIEYNVLNHTGGSFVYPLDDTFIHMSIAKNLAVHHNWGISPDTFAAASSSLLYTLLIALLFKIFSVHIIIPFIVNSIAAVILIITLQRWLKKENVNPTAQLIVFLCIIFFVPLPTLIISGMEHTLQCLFSFLFIYKFSLWLEKINVEKNNRGKLFWQVIIYGILVTAIRFEGIFLIAIACLLLLYYRKIKSAFILGITASLPIILFGIFSVMKGSYFFPNSVLLKSQNIPFSFDGIYHFFYDILVNKLTLSNDTLFNKETLSRAGITLIATQRLLIILPLAYFIFRKQIKQSNFYNHVFIILTACVLLHLSFAATGWFYRYEAYLIFCSVAFISVLIYKYGKEVFAEIKKLWAIAFVLLFALIFPLILRSSAAFTKAGQACINIYEQQYQMGQFLKKYYDTITVAANDIGAVTFFTDAGDVDLWGLGDIDVARSKKNNYYTPDFLDSLTKKRNAAIAIVYDKWFDPSLLSRWKKVATWQIQNNVICGDDTVSFYVIDENAEDDLRKNLQDYQKNLPGDVQVVYF